MNAKAIYPTGIMYNQGYLLSKQVYITPNNTIATAIK